MEEQGESDADPGLDETSGNYGAGEFQDRLGSVEAQWEGSELVLSRTGASQSSDTHEMLRFDRAQGLIRIFPRITQHGHLEDQFDHVKELLIDAPGWDFCDHTAEHDRFGLLHVRGLPQGFGSVYEYGLGVRRLYSGFIRQLEERTACRSVHFTTNGIEGVSDQVVRLSLRRFEDYVALVNRNRSRGQIAVRRVIRAVSHNATADLLQTEPIEPTYGRNPVIRALTEEVATGYVNDAASRAALVSEITRTAPDVATESPKTFSKLRDDIELVSLDALISQFEASLKGGHLSDEDHWQGFFDSNRFALQQIFSTPLVVARPQAQVRAADATGHGARIADFLCANTVTRTAMIVEIKTPGAKLVASRPYRGDGESAVFPPHKELSGAIAQVQSQLASVPQDLASRLERTPEINLDPWHDVRGALITGRVSTLTGGQRSSFLRYRAGLGSVTIIGYDEVLERLRALHALLTSPPPPSGDIA